MPEKILISELFGPVIQGEGALIGRPTLFVRTGGCDFRCAWCDTLYAVLPEFKNDWRAMTADEVMVRLEELSGGRPMLVTLSGGNPALQALGELIRTGKQRGFGFALETQGSVAKPWFAELDYLILSPKPPSSEMDCDWDDVRRCLDAAGNSPEISLKVVVFDEADYEFALATDAAFPEIPLFIQVGNPFTQAEVDGNALMDKWREISGWVLRDGLAATVLPQLHVLAYGNRRGV